MDKVYVGVLTSFRVNDANINIAVSRNKEKVSHAIYKFFIHDLNLFSRVWSAYHSLSYEEFQREFSEIAQINKFVERMGHWDNDIDYNHEFYDELVELSTIEGYIEEWVVTHSFVIEEHELIEE